MRGQWLCDAVSKAAVLGGCPLDFDGDVAARVSAGRKEIWMDGDVLCALLYQARESAMPDEKSTHFSVKVTLPLTGLLVSYKGNIEIRDEGGNVGCFFVGHRR